MRWAVSLMKGARVSMAWSASRAGRPPWRLAWATVSARGVSRFMVGSPLLLGRVRCLVRRDYGGGGGGLTGIVRKSFLERFGKAPQRRKERKEGGRKALL